MGGCGRMCDVVYGLNKHLYTFNYTAHIKCVVVVLYETLDTQRPDAVHSISSAGPNVNSGRSWPVFGLKLNRNKPTA